MKSGNLNYVKPSGPLQACNGTALHLLHLLTFVPCSEKRNLASRSLALYFCRLHFRLNVDVLVSIPVDLGPTDNVLSSLCSLSSFFTSQNSGSCYVDLYLDDMYQN